MRHPGITVALGLLLVAALAVTGREAVAGGLEREKTSFAYEGRSVRAEVIKAPGNVRSPGVLVLHGASGVGRGHYVYPYAEAMAERGLVVAVVHYFDGLPGNVRKQSVRHFRSRDRILHSAVDWLLGRQDVLPAPVGIFGYSLGAFHALSLARSDTRVGVAVALGGGLSRHIDRGAIDGMPAVLLLHGGDDPVVPIRRSIEVARLMERMDAPFEMAIYPRTGHEIGATKRRDTVRRAAEFLQGWLDWLARPAS